MTWLPSSVTSFTDDYFISDSLALSLSTLRPPLSLTSSSTDRLLSFNMLDRRVCFLAAVVAVACSAVSLAGPVQSQAYHCMTVRRTSLHPRESV